MDEDTVMKELLKLNRAVGILSEKTDTLVEKVETLETGVIEDARQKGRNEMFQKIFIATMIPMISVLGAAVIVYVVRFLTSGG